MECDTSLTLLELRAARRKSLIAVHGFGPGGCGRLRRSNGCKTIAYPHIETRLVYSPAESKVEVLDVAATISSIGYVEGTGDAVPDALRQLGINVTILSAKDIATADLSKFPAIVLGVR